jgi:hypothetical protein
MARNGRLACASFAVGVVSGGALACVIFLLLRHHDGSVLRDLPTWVGVLLGSSVLGGLATAYFNARADRRSRTDSLSDSAVDAYRRFDVAAREYLSRIQSQIGGRPDDEKLAEAYGEACMKLILLPGRGCQQIGLLAEAYKTLSEWPYSSSGLPAAAENRACKASNCLEKLRESMTNLDSGRLRIRVGLLAARRAE